MINSRFLPYLCTLILFSPLSAQEDPVNEKEFQKEYAIRITKERINGRYIPRDIPDAMKQLDQLVDAIGKAKFKAQPEETAVKAIHFSFGKWLIVNWGFYEGSRLSHHLRGLGVTYPDDMATLVMTCFHRHLHQKPLEVELMAKSFSEKRQKEWQDRLKKGKILETHTISKN